MKRWVNLFTYAVVIVIVTGVCGLLWLRTSLPTLSGTVWVSGISKRLSILRDEQGLPTITAADSHDAYFGLGFVHAQDRLWQMERMRRIGSGRLAEILGEKALPMDRFMRAMGFSHHAQDNLAKLSPETQAALRAYADGVNAWLTSHKTALPPEFVVLDLVPEPWRPEDSLLWSQLMALRLAGNWRDELLRTLMDDKLGPQKADQLWVGDPVALPPDYRGADITSDARAILGNIPHEASPTTASNIWALSPARSDTGGALLANDPHLDFDAPILWYLAKISTPQLELTGATIPGVPFHILGHNGTIAWGMTTTTSDTQDLFVERLTPEGDYETPDGPVPFETRLEIISVRGQEPVLFSVRLSRHGPIISDFMPSATAPQGHVLAFSDASLVEENLTPQAQFQLNRAKNWGEFTKALRVFHGPEQNIFYADVSGNIGYYAPARVPIRAKGDGSRPSPGWSGDYDWKGWIPFEKLPHAFNPPTGLLFNANNQLVPEGYPYLLTSHWPASYRARRILEMLTAHSRHVDQGMSAMQMDTLSLVAQDLKPYLLNLEVLSERGKAAAQLIAAWDNTIDKDRPEPLIFNAWLRELKATIFEDELGDVFPKWSGMQTRAIAYALRDGPEWCDDIATPRVDPCAGRIGLALERALVWIESRHGTNMRTWKWGAEHQADFAHTLFRYFPMLDQLTGRTFPTNGDDDTVNRGSAQGSGDGTPFRHLHGAGLRAVYDLANIEESGFMIATGQSGNPLSPFYDNLLPLWREGHSLKFGAAAHYRLVLQPEE